MIYEWCPRACATVLESFPPLDDDGKEDFEAAIKNPSAFERDLKEAGAGQPMSAHSQRRAIRALQNFLAPVAPKNAPAEKSTREENITDPCRRDVRQASDELSGELSNGIVKCYLGLAIRAVIGAVVGPLDNSINDIKAANAYTRSEMDNVLV